MNTGIGRRAALVGLGLSALMYAAGFGAEEEDSLQYGLGLGEIGSWPRRAIEAWRYDNPHLRWKAFLLWENEGRWMAIDKEAHFACCYGGILTGELVGLTTMEAVALVSTAALLNELVEWKLGFWIHPKQRGISIKDIIVDACGIGVGLLVINRFAQND